MGIGITNLDKDKRKVFTLTMEVLFLGERNDYTGILKGRSETKTFENQCCRCSRYFKGSSAKLENYNFDLATVYLTKKRARK